MTLKTDRDLLDFDTFSHLKMYLASQDSRLLGTRIMLIISLEIQDWLCERNTQRQTTSSRNNPLVAQRRERSTKFGNGVGLFSHRPGQHVGHDIGQYFVGLDCSKSGRDDDLRDRPSDALAWGF